jgi:NACalpha-BTF3-like transcription factor
MVTTGRDYGNDLYKSCTEMMMCDYQDACSTGKRHDTYYCNHHAETDLFDAEEHQKTGDTLKICLQCKSYQQRLAELQKLSYFKPEDIELVQSQTKCSKKVAVEALLKNQCDIVIAIMEIQLH